jgi:hypothetical protein
MTPTPPATPPVTTAAAGPSSRASKVFTSFVGLTALGVLLQGVWAGLFLRGETRDMDWVDIHGIGGDATTLFALLATITAVGWLRSRRPLLVGSVLLLVLLIAEAVLGRQITDNAEDDLTAVHVPLALVIMSLTVWLSVKAVQLRRAGNG